MVAVIVVILKACKAPFGPMALLVGHNDPNMGHFERAYFS